MSNKWEIDLGRNMVTCHWSDDVVSEFAIDKLSFGTRDRVTLHGLKAKLGDGHAGKTATPTKARQLTVAIWERLCEGEWTTKRPKLSAKIAIDAIMAAYPDNLEVEVSGMVTARFNEKGFAAILLADKKISTYLAHEYGIGIRKASKTIADLGITT